MMCGGTEILLLDSAMWYYALGVEVIETRRTTISVGFAFLLLIFRVKPQPTSVGTVDKYS